MESLKAKIDIQRTLLNELRKKHKTELDNLAKLYREIENTEWKKLTKMQNEYAPFCSHDEINRAYSLCLECNTVIDTDD